ncbi:MAG: HPr kinase/phosphatase C-terminal domain-containing protein [Erythrobacter sp.]
MTSGPDTALVQASAVAIGGRALLIEGQSGIGKSSLALALIDRGAVLIGDDGVRLSLESDRVLASPPPNITGKLEIRHVGIADVPVTSAPLALIITLGKDAPRFVDEAPRRDVKGISVPCITLPAHDPILALRAEWALTLHGLCMG